MPDLVAMPTTCKPTMAMLLSCGHIMFGCGDEPEYLLAKLTLMRKYTIRCKFCGQPFPERLIEHVWEMG